MLFHSFSFRWKLELDSITLDQTARQSNVKIANFGRYLLLSLFWSIQWSNKCLFKAQWKCIFRTFFQDLLPTDSTGWKQLIYCKMKILRYNYASVQKHRRTMRIFWLECLVNFPVLSAFLWSLFIKWTLNELACTIRQKDECLLFTHSLPTLWRSFSAKWENLSRLVAPSRHTFWLFTIQKSFPIMSRSFK